MHITPASGLFLMEVLFLARKTDGAFAVLLCWMVGLLDIGWDSLSGAVLGTIVVVAGVGLRWCEVCADRVD